MLQILTARSVCVSIDVSGKNEDDGHILHKVALSLLQNYTSTYFVTNCHANTIKTRVYNISLNSYKDSPRVTSLSCLTLERMTLIVAVEERVLCEWGVESVGGSSNIYNNTRRVT